MNGTDAQRELVSLLERRGIRNRRVLDAMARVPREDFVPHRLREFAYADTALPIDEEQTISQPLVVALMAEAAEIGPDDRVLEVGTGSGYAAAVFAELGSEVYSVERHETLAESARDRLRALGVDNVHVLHGDGTLGWEEHAPYDAILVAAGGPEVPPSLMEQLASGGRLVIPVGATVREQELVRLVRTDGELIREDLGGVRFVPLIGREGWDDPAEGSGNPGPATGGDELPRFANPAPPLTRPGDPATVALLRECAEPLHDCETDDLGSFTERVGSARAVLLGEATHGTSEFYRMRAHITRELVEHHGVRILTLEADWPDAARLNRWIRGEPESRRWRPFDRFPTWMWRNKEVEGLVAWLRDWNQGRPPEDQAGIYGLDLYSLFRSMDAVVEYLDRVDPDAAQVARERYGCLEPWQRDPVAYGRAALTDPFTRCEAEAVAMLQDLLKRELDYAVHDGDAFLDAVRNARLVQDAERYYRIMYRGGHASWNHRDRHMADTLFALLDWRGSDARAVVWAHNSHVGDHQATELGGQGQVALGGLTRDRLGNDAYLVGFGTDRGTVLAADYWDGPGHRKRLRPAHPGSYEALCHSTGTQAFTLHLREPAREALTDELLSPRLHRAVGVIYRPETELQSHYYQVVLPHQFDTWIWMDRTEAVHPIPTAPAAGVPETYPFGY